MPPRYRANAADLFFKARYELPPGTILYADISAFYKFIYRTPEALRNCNDSAWDSPFPAGEPGVYILEARNVSSGLSGPPCLLPESRNISMDLSASGTCAVDVSSSARYWTPALAAAQAFLTPRDERSKTEDEAIAAAHAGYLPPPVVFGTLATCKSPSQVVRIETGWP